MIINNTSDTQPGAIVILGAGITGLVLARQLSAHFGNRVIVVEKEDHIGGMASTRSYKGMRYDVGSHRIHPDFLPRALEYLTQDLDVRILEKRRNGKMYFRGKFVRYPPVPLDIIRNMSIAECRELALCYLRAFPLPIRTMQSYEEVVVHRAGKRMHPDFYTECALKLWGVHPGDMSVDSLKRRKTVFDRTSLMRFFSGRTRKFFYPEKGIGIVAENAGAAALKNGALLYRNSSIDSIQMNGSAVGTLTIRDENGQRFGHRVDALISTIPLDTFHALLMPDRAPVSLLQWRDILILYAYFSNKKIMEEETLYFPTREVTIGRVSDIYKYSHTLHGEGEKTLLTIEIPVSKHDALWQMSDAQLGGICFDDLKKVGVLTDSSNLMDCFSVRREKAYPLYTKEWKKTFQSLYDDINRFTNVFSIGRNGLFLHCNIDHCIVQSMELSSFLVKGCSGGKEKWIEHSRHYADFSARD